MLISSKIRLKLRAKNIIFGGDFNQIDAKRVVRQDYGDHERRSRAYGGIRTIKLIYMHLIAGKLSNSALSAELLSDTVIVKLSVRRVRFLLSAHL